MGLRSASACHRSPVREREETGSASREAVAEDVAVGVAAHVASDVAENVAIARCVGGAHSGMVRAPGRCVEHRSPQGTMSSVVWEGRTQAWRARPAGGAIGFCALVSAKKQKWIHISAVNSIGKKAAPLMAPLNVENGELGSACCAMRISNC